MDPGNKKTRAAGSLRRHHGPVAAVLGAEGLYNYIVGQDEKSHLVDIRPLQVVLRYLAGMGYQPALSGAGTPVLVSTNGREVAVWQISIAKMLYMCREASRTAQNEAQSAYARLCAEEDEEEISFLLECLCHQKKGCGRDAPVAPAQYQSEVKPLVIDISDEESEGAQLLSKTFPGKTSPLGKDGYVPPHLLF